jgi:transposase
MYIERIANRSSPPAILLRESYREGDRVRKRTLANLSHWPEDRVEALRAVLRGATTIADLEQAFEIARSLPHGHVDAVLGSLRRLGLDRVIASRRSRARDLVVAMIVERVIEPRSKLATARRLDASTASSTLGEVLELGSVTEEELYGAMDWLLERQGRIERRLVDRHLSEGALVLYDLTSSYFEGRCCPLARIGYSRDGKKNHLQITVGLMCDRQGCPVSVEVFEGNVGDPTTFRRQVKKAREEFGLQEVVFVGDRGMITSARIREDLQPVPGMGWITSLRAPQVRKLVEGEILQLSLFDERDLGEIASPDYPGERLIACRNPLLAEKRRRKRDELLTATERELEKIARATRRERRPLRGKDAIGLRVGRVLGRFKMAKHFEIKIEDRSFQYRRNEQGVAQEAALDGIYVVRTNVPDDRMDAENVVRSYKSLSKVERAFRSLKTIDLKLRPIHHYLAKRVRAHVFLCMLAYYVEWHMRGALRPMLFDDEDPEAAEAQRASVVAPARPSPAARAKARRKTTEDAEPVFSFRGLLDHLATQARNRIVPKLPGAEPFTQLSRPTDVQDRASQLLRNCSYPKTT